MFVRWRRRELRASKYRGTTRRGADALLSVSLVESVRINGRPRQRTVKYLGSIQQWRIGQAAYYPLRDFWQGVCSRLDTLTLPNKARREIESRIAAVVPQPTEALLKKNRKAFSAEMNRIKKAKG